jgi:hypothetical protein
VPQRPRRLRPGCTNGGHEARAAPPIPTALPTRGHQPHLAENHQANPPWRGAAGIRTTCDAVRHPGVAGDYFLFTSGQVASLDSTGQAAVTANPGNSSLQSLLDSTLQVFTAGVTAKRVDVNTDLTTVPLYFIGIHRVVAQANGSFSTWTLVGMDDPQALVNLVEVSGFAQTTTATAPSSVSGAIGTGAVNGLFLKVAAGGAVTQWSGNAGTVSFSSDAATVACPVANPSANITCAIETMHVHFDVSAADGTAGAPARHATVATDVDVPTMRLTYTGP